MDLTPANEDGDAVAIVAEEQERVEHAQLVGGVDGVFELRQWGCWRRTDQLLYPDGTLRRMRATLLLTQCCLRRQGCR